MEVKRNIPPPVEVTYDIIGLRGSDFQAILDALWSDIHRLK